MVPLFLQILGTAIIAYVIYRKVHSYTKHRAYPPFVSAQWLPFVGHVLGFGVDPVAFLLKQKKQVGDIFAFELFGSDCVFLGDTESVDAFYSAKDDVLSAKEAYKFTIPAFGRGVVYDMPHGKFQEQRRMAHSTLNVQQFKKFVPMIEEEATKYLEQVWKEEGQVDFYNAVSEIVMRTSTRCLQGDQVRAIMNDGYVQWMADIDSSLNIFSFFFPNFPLPSFRKRDLARQRIGDIFKKILRHREENQYEGEDFLEVMRNKQYKDGTKMSQEEIAGLSVALMLAGYHTSNITSSWVALHILAHPEVYQKVLEEQAEIVGDGSLDFDKVKSMEYLESCMSESLRIRPPIILIFRKAMQDIKIKDYVIPTGTLVCVSPATRHLDPQFFKDPEQYNPSRFLNLPQEKEKNYSYIPFSTGEHYCIGEKFAYLQVKTILSVIFRQYTLSLIGTLKDYPVDNTTMMAGPIKPVKVTYQKKK